MAVLFLLSLLDYQCNPILVTTYYFWLTGVANKFCITGIIAVHTLDNYVFEWITTQKLLI